MELEGLRVLAAVVVVLYHAALIFYPGFFYGVGTALAPVQNARIETGLYQNPISGFLSGTFAVGIFFVLSGFVLSIAFFQRKDQNIIKKMAAKRYVRLMIPALFSVIIAWAVMSVGWTKTMAQTVAITHSGWLANLWTFTPHLHSAIYQGIVAIFTVGDVTYNYVLWTIHYEFLGSFIVFGLALLAYDMKNRWVVYAAMIFILANSWLLGFILGMALADVYVNKQAIIKTIDGRIKVALILIGIVFGSYPAGPITSPVYKFLQIPGFDQTQQISFFITIGAACVVFSALTLKPLTKFLANPHLSKFGRYTYSLYLIHMPVLFTVCTGSFLFFYPYLGLHKASIVAIFVFIMVLLPVVYLFERFVDATALRYASSSASLFLENDLFAWGRSVAYKILRRIIRKREPKEARALPDIETEA